MRLNVVNIHGPVSVIVDKHGINPGIVGIVGIVGVVYIGNTAFKVELYIGMRVSLAVIVDFTGKIFIQKLDTLLYLGLAYPPVSIKIIINLGFHRDPKNRKLVKATLYGNLSSLLHFRLWSALAHTID